jgi:hypothetical protein
VEIVAVAGALTVTLLFALWLVLHIGGSTDVRYFDDIVTALAALTACVTCLLAAKRSKGAGRRFWVLLGLALGAWTSAEVIWGVYDLVLRVAIPVPSWADAGYLTAIPLAAAALLSHPGMQTGGTHRARATLDGLAIGAALLLLSWTFVLSHLWRDNHLSTSGGVVAFAYPFGDMVIIFLVVLSMRSVTSGGRRPLIWVLAGLSAMAIADSTYAYLVEAGRYATGNLVDTGWVIAYLAIAVGAASESGAAVRVVPLKTDQADLASFVIPYVPILSALSVITIELQLHHHLDRVSWLTGFGLALLVVARQVLSLLDRRHELFPAPPEPPESTARSGAGPERAENLIEAAPWPQFVRRVP